MSVSWAKSLARLQENLDKNILPSIGSVYDPPGMLDTYAWVRRVRDAGHLQSAQHSPEITSERSLDHEIANLGLLPGFARPLGCLVLG